MVIKDSKGEVIIEELKIFDTFSKRLKGLMFEDEIPSGYAVLLEPCNSIHTFFMKFDIGVIYLDERDMVIRGPETMKSWRLGPIVKSAKKVIEYDYRNTDIKVNIGDKLKIL